MPRFYFDVMEVDGSITEDLFGLELSSTAEAKSEANRALAELTGEEIQRGNDFSLSIRIRDHNGREINSRQSDVFERSFGR